LFRRVRGLVRRAIVQVRDPELLLLLAVHPFTGVQREVLASMLWIEPTGPSALRKRRFNLRMELRWLVPEVTADPLSPHACGQNVVALDGSVVSSDVHEFTELLRCAEKLEPSAAVEAYQSAIGLYDGDLLDCADTPNYRWMYDEEPQVGLILRSELRRRHQQGRLQLGQLLEHSHRLDLDSGRSQLKEDNR
jgi:DNA-binding SARP family transcriptional activator